MIKKQKLQDKYDLKMSEELEEDEADILPLYEQVKQELESES